MDRMQIEAKARGTRVQYMLAQFYFGAIGVAALAAAVWLASHAFDEGLDTQAAVYVVGFAAIPALLAGAFLGPVVGIQLRREWGWSWALAVSIVSVVLMPIGLFGLLLVLMGGGRAGYLQMWEVLDGGQLQTQLERMDPQKRTRLYQGVSVLIGFAMLLGGIELVEIFVALGWPTEVMSYLAWGLVGTAGLLFEGGCAAIVFVLLRRRAWGLGVFASVLMLLGLVTAPVGILGLWVLLSKGGREGFEGKLDLPSSPPENDAPTQILRPFSAAEAPTERFDASRHAAVLEATQKPAPEPTADAPAATESPDGLDRAAVGLMTAQAVFAGLFVLVGLLGMGVGFVADRIGSGVQWQGFGGLALVALLGAALFGGLARGMKRRKGWAWTAGMVLLLPQLLMGNLLVAVPLVHLLRPKGRKEYGVGWQAPTWFDHALS